MVTENTTVVLYRETSAAHQLVRIHTHIVQSSAEAPKRGSPIRQYIRSYLPDMRYTLPRSNVARSARMKIASSGAWIPQNIEMTRYSYKTTILYIWKIIEYCLGLQGFFHQVSRWHTLIMMFESPVGGGPVGSPRRAYPTFGVLRTTVYQFRDSARIVSCALNLLGVSPTESRGGISWLEYYKALSAVVQCVRLIVPNLLSVSSGVQYINLLTLPASSHARIFCWLFHPPFLNHQWIPLSPGPCILTATRYWNLVGSLIRPKVSL